MQSYDGQLRVCSQCQWLSVRLSVKFAYFREGKSGKSNGVFGSGGSCNNSFVLKHDLAIASEVPISSQNFLARTDFLVEKTQLINYCRNPTSWNPPILASQLKRDCNCDPHGKARKIGALNQGIPPKQSV